MQSLILTLHIVVCVLLVILILLQSGKEGMGVIFGGGNSSVFGNTGAGGILVKLTTLMALIFVVTSLSYTYVTSAHEEKTSTILDVKIEDPIKATPTPADEAGSAKPDTPASHDAAKEPASEAPKDSGALAPQSDPKQAAEPKPSHEASPGNQPTDAPKTESSPSGKQ
ncbi:MAG: preprotein translocase subunit SecG [Desulfovibrio sp.]|nr:preprotein translocase subunit SecG [Desulfovibrio sp.]